MQLPFIGWFKKQSNVRGQIAHFAEDVMTLEINTILKENMSATKMFDIRHGLIDIGQGYQMELTNLRATGQWEDADWDTAGSYDLFERYRLLAKERADALEKNIKDGLEEDDPANLANLYMLLRIKETSAQIKEILNRRNFKSRFTRISLLGNSTVPALDLPSDEYGLIRKAWEVGTERIVAQTVVQMGGDVVTRIAPQFAGDNSALLLKTHRDSTGVSIEFWSELVEIISSTLGGLLGKRPAA